MQNFNHHCLNFLREYRVVTLGLIAFMIYWGWDAYQFVNAHYANMQGFIIAFYVSIVGGAIAVIKFWTSSHASSPKDIINKDGNL